MQWLVAWLRQIVGPPHVDPWEHDPQIRAERKGQHERIGRAARYSVRDQWNERVRESWRPERRPHA